MPHAFNPSAQSEIHIVVYFMPNARFPASTYPKGHIETLTSYLTGGNRRPVNQISCSGKKAVLAFPLFPGSAEDVPLVGNASSLRQWLFEVAYWVRKSTPPHPTTVSLGTCAVSGFSAGGTTVLDVLKNMDALPELKEAYLFDPADNKSIEFPRTDSLLAWIKKQHPAYIHSRIEMAYRN